MKRTIATCVALVVLATFGVTRPVAQHQGTSQFQLVEATLSDIQKALQTRLITSEQLVEMYLARIAAYEATGPALNAFIHVDANGALAEARQLDALRHPGRARSPLYGIPVALKDIIDTVDMPTTGGSLTLQGSTPPDDAFITQKLRDAGAIIIGKLTLTEFANFIAIGMPAGYSGLGLYGFNPYLPEVLQGGDGRPALLPGGSSSASGISVAANLVAIAVGTETSGSILSPASANGVVGIKPTVGLVSRNGIIPITADQDTAGPFGRTVEDAAVLLGVLAGFDPTDPATIPCLTAGNCFSDYTRFLDKKALKGARIAVPPFPANRESTKIAAIAALRAQGAFVEEIPALPAVLGSCTAYPPPANCSTVLMYGQKRDMNAYLATRPNAPVHTLGDIVARNIQIGAASLKYGQAIFEAANQINLDPASADTARYLADRAADLATSRGGIDGVLNGPDGMAGTPDDFDAILSSNNSFAATPAKAGYPSITVPAGLIPANPAIEQAPNALQPTNITFTGRAFSEPQLIALAYAWEQATHLRQPPASTPPLASDFVRRP